MEKWSWTGRKIAMINDKELIGAREKTEESITEMKVDKYINL